MSSILKLETDFFFSLNQTVEKVDFFPSISNSFKFQCPFNEISRSFRHERIIAALNEFGRSQKNLIKVSDRVGCRAKEKMNYFSCAFVFYLLSKYCAKKPVFFTIRRIKENTILLFFTPCLYSNPTSNYYNADWFPF